MDKPLVRRNKVKQTSVSKRGSNKNRFIVTKLLMYDAVGITFFFTVYAYVGSSVHNRLIDFSGRTVIISWIWINTLPEKTLFSMRP